MSQFLFGSASCPVVPMTYRLAYRFVSRLVYSTTAIISISTIASG